MPELPEVEVHARRLARWTGGLEVAAVRVADFAAVRTRMSTTTADAHPDGERALRGLVGAVSAGTWRVGKRLGWRFGAAAPQLLVHLGMTGRWVRRPQAEEPPRWGRIGLVFGDTAVWFVDTRRFGCVVPLTPDQLDDAMTRDLGPDALVPLAPEALAARFAKTRSPIKVALMDQARLAGLGNIHAAEALWRARVHPATRADQVTAEGWSALAAVIPAWLAQVVRDEDGDDDVVYMTDGGADNPFAVYARADQACIRCGSAIDRAVLGGRSTFWCPTCQPPTP
jgi:formamidopyrimidine-DNA glycosylase